MGVFRKLDVFSATVQAVAAAYNHLVNRDSGASADDAEQIRWTMYDGVEKDPHASAASTTGHDTLLLRNTAGIHIAILLAATAPTATPSPANALLLGRDAGLSLGAGKEWRVYGPAGSGYLSLTSDNNGLATLAGSGTSNGLLALVALLLGAHPATVGSVRLSSAGSIYARNNANAADIRLLDITAGDVIEVGQTGTVLDLLGTIVAPSITPPTVEGQVTARSLCKGYVQGTVAATVLTVNQSYNLTSCTRTSAGIFVVTWDRDFTDALYPIVVTHGAAATGLVYCLTAQTATACTIQFSTGGVATDPLSFSVVAFGTLI